MKATIQLHESEIKSAICAWLIREYGISVSATDDIRLNSYPEEYTGDPQYAPARPDMKHGAEISVPNIQLKKK